MQYPIIEPVRSFNEKAFAEYRKNPSQNLYTKKVFLSQTSEPYKKGYVLTTREDCFQYFRNLESAIRSKEAYERAYLLK